MDYVRYLQAKRTVDNRSLNWKVLKDFETHISRGSQEDDSLLRVLEVGAGTGAMLLRLYQRKAIFCKYKQVYYTFVDIKRKVLDAASAEVRSFLDVSGRSTSAAPSQLATEELPTNISDGDSVHKAGEADASPTIISEVDIGNTHITFVLDDAMRYLQDQRNCFDVIIAAAVLDLWELDYSLPIMFNALDKQRGIGAFYFPINFDGTTDLFPPSSHGPDFDKFVEDTFHGAMGKRKTLGYHTTACHTGRLLFPMIRGLKANVKSAGGSTWLVAPAPHGGYPNDEQYFLETIVSFIASSLPNDKSEPFLSSRLKQIQNSELFYTAHNIDYFGTVCES